MKYLLDTDSVSFAMRGVGGVGARILAARPSEIAISAITLAELGSAPIGRDRESCTG